MIKLTSLSAGVILLAMSFGLSTTASADQVTAVNKSHETQIAMSHGDHGGMKNAKTIIKRRTIFRCIATGLKKIKKGKGNAKNNAALALKNAAILNQNLKKLFPKGSYKGKTRAKAALWKDWGKFEKQSAALKAASAKLVLAADSGNAKKGLKAVYKTCKGCHKPFRGKKNKKHGKVKCK